MGHRFQRLLSNSSDGLSPGQFVNLVYESIAGCASKVVICCPSCGTKKTLTAEYKIRQGGKVEPAVSCDGCAFFELIELESWGEVV